MRFYKVFGDLSLARKPKEIKHFRLSKERRIPRVFRTLTSLGAGNGRGFLRGNSAHWLTMFRGGPFLPSAAPEHPS